MRYFRSTVKERRSYFEWHSLPTVDKESFWSDAIGPRELVDGTKISDTIRRHHPLLDLPRLPQVWDFSTEFRKKFQWRERRTIQTLSRTGYIIEFLRGILLKPFVYTRVIDDLGDSRYALREPIPIEVEISKDGIVCSWDYTYRYGSGDTLEEALHELEEEIVILYEALNDKEDGYLSKELKGWKQVLNRVVKKVNE